MKVSPVWFMRSLGGLVRDSFQTKCSVPAAKKSPKRYVKKGKNNKVTKKRAQTTKKQLEDFKSCKEFI